MKKILLLLTTVLSLTSNAYYTKCFQTENATKFVDIYRINGDYIDTDGWDYYYGMLSDVHNDLLDSDATWVLNSYERLMEEHENETVFGIESDKESRNERVIVAVNGDNYRVILTITNEYHKRLAYGLRTFVTSRYYVGAKEKAKIGYIRAEGSKHEDTLYCFE